MKTIEEQSGEIKLTFSDKTTFNYDVSDGGYSCWRFSVNPSEEGTSKPNENINSILDKIKEEFNEKITTEADALYEKDAVANASCYAHCTREKFFGIKQGLEYGMQVIDKYKE